MTKFNQIVGDSIKPNILIVAHKNIENFDDHQFETDLETGYLRFTSSDIVPSQQKLIKIRLKVQAIDKDVKMCTSAMHPGHNVYYNIVSFEANSEQSTRLFQNNEEEKP